MVRRSPLPWRGQRRRGPDSSALGLATMSDTTPREGVINLRRIGGSAMPMGDTLQSFAAEVRRSDADLDLGYAALLIAAGEYPQLSLDTAHALLDEIATSIA